MDEKPPVEIGYPQIYTTGAFVSPGRITVNGREIWIWIVESFEGDSFFEGEEILPIEHSLNKDALVQLIEEEEE